MMAMLKIGDFVEFVPPKPVDVPVAKLWYLLRIQPNREIPVCERLIERGAVAYVPREIGSRRTSFNRRVESERPIFSGVLFVPDFDAVLPRLRSLADGIVGFVMFGNTAAAANLTTMNAVRDLEATLRLPAGQRKLKRSYQLNQKVRVVDGPFEFFEGPIERLDANGRLRVLLDVIGRQVPVELDETQIEAV